MFEVGDILDGKVTGMTSFGAFISLPENKTGMVHISEVASVYVSDIHDHLKEGQQVKVKVIDITPQGKISLSIKKAVEDDSAVQAKQAKKSSHRNGNASVWRGTPEKSSEPQSFEDMMAHFKQISDEKMTDLKRAADGKRGSYSKRK